MQGAVANSPISITLSRREPGRGPVCESAIRSVTCHRQVTDMPARLRPSMLRPVADQLQTCLLVRER